MVRASAQYFDPTTQQKPCRHGLCRTLRKEFHWKCLLSTLLVHLCISYTVWCHFSYYAYAPANAAIFTYAHGPCAPGYNFIPIGFGLLLYLVYLTECWHHRSKYKGIPKRGAADVRDLVERMRTAIPIVWWKSVCYHYLRRTRQVTRYRNGDAITATQVFYERVNSHSSGNVFLYDTAGFRDISKDLVDLERYPLIRMRFTKGFVFACVQAATEFEDQRTRFFNENEVRDDYMEVREGLDLADVPFFEQLIVFPQSSNVEPEYRDPNEESPVTSPAHLPLKTPNCEPWFLKGTVYWIASAFLMSWPLRMLVEWKTAHLHYQITKLFGTNYLSPSSVNYTGPLTRTSTMETSELEIANRQNYLMVPSYSEAILLDPLITTTSNINCLGFRQPVPSIRNDFLPRNQPLVSTNEASIFTNYGALDPNESPFRRLNNLPQRLFGTSSGAQRPEFFREHQYSRFEEENHTSSNTGQSWQSSKFPKSRSMSFFNPKNQIRRPNPPKSSAAVPVPRPSKLAVGGRFSNAFTNNTAYTIDEDVEYSAGPPKRSASISGAIGCAEVHWSNGATIPEFEPVNDRRPLLFGIPRHAGPCDGPPPPYEVALRICAPLYHHLHNRLRQSAHSISSLLNQAVTRSSSKDLRQTQQQYDPEEPSSSSTAYENIDQSARDRPSLA